MCILESQLVYSWRSVVSVNPALVSVNRHLSDKH